MFRVERADMDDPRAGPAWEELRRSGFVAKGVRWDFAARRRVWVFERTSLPRAPRGGGTFTFVLDLNNVLSIKWWDPRRAFPGNARWHHLSFFLRPGARKLLRELRAANHIVVLWSSMQREAVDAVAALLPHDLALCNEDAPRDEEFPEVREGGRNVAIVKDLRVVWEKLAGRADPRRTILIDDSARKARAFPELHVQPPSNFAPSSPWDPLCVFDRGIAELSELCERRIL